ncbi:MAG TPA: dethiobiotin synthase [Nocardioidaceae bacterium]|nr:dethiobiotin synthase [Nocardioidaceae bacterium]
MRLPRVVVVTGTDTEVGKTVVTAALAASIGRDRKVAVLKPAQTGVGDGDAGDADEVRRLSGLESVHEGIRLRDPLAPTTAARREGVTLPSVAEHAATVRELAATHDVVLVEGAGGLLVGLDSQGAGLSELASALELPFGFVVVARGGLGTLNHSGLTTEAIRRRGHPVLGLVVGSAPRVPGLAEQTNLADLEGVTGVPLIGMLPAGAGSMPPAEFRSAAPGWFGPPVTQSWARGPVEMD